MGIASKPNITTFYECIEKINSQTVRFDTNHLEGITECP